MRVRLAREVVLKNQCTGTRCHRCDPAAALARKKLYNKFTMSGGPIEEYYGLDISSPRPGVWQLSASGYIGALPGSGPVPGGGPGGAPRCRALGEEQPHGGSKISVWFWRLASRACWRRSLR